MPIPIVTNSFLRLKEQNKLKIKGAVKYTTNIFFKHIFLLEEWNTHTISFKLICITYRLMFMCISLLDVKFLLWWLCFSGQTNSTVI